MVNPQFNLDQLIEDARPKVLDTKVPGVIAIIAENEVKVQDIEDKLNAPRRANGTRTVQTPEGFAAALKLIEDVKPVLYESGSGCVTAILNHTRKEEEPQWEDWSIMYKPRLHNYFLPFSQKNGVEMSQTDFAEFLQDNALAIESPTLAEIEESVLGFESARSSSFASKVNQANGTLQFAYTEAEQVKGTVVVPAHLRIVCPIIDGGEPKASIAHVRYRIIDQKVKFRFVIEMMNVVLENEYRELHTKIETLTGLTIIR